MPSVIFVVIIGIRLYTSKTLEELLLTYLIKGWMEQKPSGIVHGRMSLSQWNKIKLSVAEWIEYYSIIQVNLYGYIYF